MNDLRLTSNFQMPSLFPTQIGPGSNLQGAPATTVFPSQGLQLSRATDLTGLSFSQLSSNPTHALPLLAQQGDVANDITGGPTQDPAKTTEQVARGFDTAAAKGSALLEQTGDAAGKLGRKLGVLGPGVGVIGEAVALPAGIKAAKKSIDQALETGDKTDVIRAGGDTAAVASGATSLVKGALEIPEAMVTGKARAAATEAFKQKAPNASKKVVTAAANKAAKEALEGATRAEARKATIKSATQAANKVGTLTEATGAASRTAAKKILKHGGEGAAKAAAKVVGESALKGAAKAGARFVPGLNIAVAGLDTTAATATLADPKASAGKKGASVVTAAGSIVAATNIPIVSQAGAAISAAGSFVGAFL